ncbi:hypothetical protein ACOMHN_035928 [Nucella lapillus]
MSESGSNTGQGQAGSYLNGVWLSKAGGARSEKYHRWTDERTKYKMENLDRQKHSSMVKLNCEQLQVRTELRGLQHDRRQLNRGRKGSTEGSESLQRPTSVSPSSTDASRRRLQKGSSTGSLASASSTGYPSLSSASSPSTFSSSSSSSAFRRSGSSVEGGWGGKVMSVRGKAVEPKRLDPEATANKLRNLHSSRALSKLKNNMDIND